MEPKYRKGALNLHPEIDTQFPKETRGPATPKQEEDSSQCLGGKRPCPTSPKNKEKLKTVMGTDGTGGRMVQMTVGAGTRQETAGGG